MSTRLVRPEEVSQEHTVVDWVRERMMSRFQWSKGRRCTGRSSDALVVFALGGPRPCSFGRPEPGSRNGVFVGSDCDTNCPADEGDLAACERTWLMAPDEQRALMLPVLREFQAYVLDGLNRYGEPIRAPRHEHELKVTL